MTSQLRQWLRSPPRYVAPHTHARRYVSMTRACVYTFLVLVVLVTAYTMGWASR